MLLLVQVGDTYVLCMLHLAFFLCLFPPRTARGSCSSRVVPYPAGLKEKQVSSLVSSQWHPCCCSLLPQAARQAPTSPTGCQTPAPITASPLPAVAVCCLIEVSRCLWKAACISVQQSNWKELAAKSVWMGWPNSTANLRGMVWTCLVAVLFVFSLKM